LSCIEAAEELDASIIFTSSNQQVVVTDIGVELTGAFGAAVRREHRRGEAAWQMGRQKGLVQLRNPQERAHVSVAIAKRVLPFSRYPALCSKTLPLTAAP